MKLTELFWKKNNVPFAKGTRPQVGGVLFTIALLLLLNSCLTVSRIERNCDKFAQICIIESKTIINIETRDSLITYLDTIPVPLPYYDTTKVEIELKPDSTGEITIEPIHEEFGLIAVDVQIKNNKLYVNAYLTDSTLVYIENDSVNVKDAIKTTTTTTNNNIVLPPEKYIPGFYHFTFWFFIMVMISALFWVAKRFIPFKF